MADPGPLEKIWIGKDEAGGIPVPKRKDVPPPPHWRLEAIAHTARPRSLTVSADGTRAVFVEDRDTSDLYVLELGGERGGAASPSGGGGGGEAATPSGGDGDGEAGSPSGGGRSGGAASPSGEHTAAPERLTTGRELAPFWEDTQPRISPDGSTVAYAQDEHVWLVPIAGGAPRRLVEGGGPVWLDDQRLIISIEHEIETTRTTRLAVVNVADPFPRRLVTVHDDLDALGDEEDATVTPDGAEVAYVFVPRGDLKRAEIRVVDVVTGRARALTGTPEMADLAPAWSPDGTTIAYVSERPGRREVHLVGRDGSGDRQLTHEDADFAHLAWRPDGNAIAAVRGRQGRFDLVLVDPATGAVERLARGGLWDRPAWTAAGDIVAGYEDHATPAELRRVAAEPAGATDEGDRATRPIHAPAPLSIKRAPHVTPEHVTYTSFDGLEIPAFLFRPPGASAETPVAAVVSPHGGPTDAYVDDHDSRAQYFVAKGYAWLAPNFRGSTGYGRDFERLNHGVWGVDDTKDCIAAADFLRSLDWVDGERLAIAGGSYGSYMATLAVTDDPEHRYRCAVAMYGDVDIVTSWAQGDRLGVQDLERMMGPPAAARAAYLAGSAVHRLENVTAPLLIAHGERDDRVSPAQSEEHVAALRRLSKTFEYVTYPTEAHGFLRSGPQLHFNRRLERFLDWYLM